jgi:calcineurin-like phosphoesterase family protein
MPTDKQLYNEWQAKFANHSITQAADLLASRYNLSPDSVRGRLSRTMGSYTTDLKHLATKTNEVDPSIERQDTVLDHSAGIWNYARPYMNTAVWASDIHLPYARWDAIELLFRIMSNIPKIDLFTVGNDLLDNSAFGRWDDKRPAGGQRWSSDLSYMRNLEESFYRQVREATNAGLLQVQGNHDNWWFAHLRENAPHVAESVIADYMERLDEQGVIQFSKGYTEPEVWLNEDLVFWHGQFASNKATANAANSMKQFTKNGKTPSVVVGHTHRPSTVEGYQIGYNGRTFINAPCLSRIENVPYIKRNPQGWGLGFVVAEYDNTGWHKLTRIDFVERGKNLVAEYKGRDYSVTLDKSVPKEY